MPHLFYGVAGEGRGHAARARTVVEAMAGWRFTLFAPDEAFAYLAPQYAGSERVRVVQIPGLRFHYSQGRLDLVKSTWRGLEYWWQLPRTVNLIRRAIQSERPDLLVTDFDPATPRAAEREGLPYVSLDHQNFLTTYDLTGLAPRLAWRAWWNAQVVRACYRRQRVSIVSAFFAPPLRPGTGTVVQVGPILRQEIRDARPSDGEHFVSYLRQNTPSAILEAMVGLGAPGRARRPRCRSDRR